MDALLTGLLVCILLGSAAAGLWLRRRLDPRHLSRDTLDSIRVLMGMLLTFTAIVLGLLVTNAKQRFDALSDSLNGYSAGLIELDSGLRAYGADAVPIRGELRRYTRAAIADTWPDDAVPGRPDDDPVPRRRDERAAAPAPLESRVLGGVLGEVADQIERLAPADAAGEHLAARLRQQIGTLADQRWRLIALSGATRSWPFLLILTAWLAIIFAIFGMTSPPGRVIYVAVALAAVSVASPVYLILEYDDALTGTIVLSSQSMRAALAHMDAP